MVEEKPREDIVAKAKMVIHAYIISPYCLSYSDYYALIFSNDAIMRTDVKWMDFSWSRKIAF